MTLLLLFIALPLIIEVLRGKRFTFWHLLAMSCVAALVLQGRIEFAAMLLLGLTAFTLVR